MKARLVAKLGSNGLLGVPRGRFWDNKTFCLQYIDPYQKREPQEHGESDRAEEGKDSEIDEEMGRAVLVRNEREWQQCWEIALQEDDNELEVDIVELLPEHVLPDEPASTPSRLENFRPPNLDDVVPFDASELTEEILPRGSDSNSQADAYGGTWTDDEGDEGNDGPGLSPDVHLSTRSPVQGQADHTLLHLDSVKEAAAGGRQSSSRGSTARVSASGSSVGSEQARQELLRLDSSARKMVSVVYEDVIADFPSRSASQSESAGSGTDRLPASGSGHGEELYRGREPPAS